MSGFGSGSRCLTLRRFRLMSSDSVLEDMTTFEPACLRNDKVYAVDRLVEIRQLPASDLTLSDFVPDEPYASVASIEDPAITTEVDLIHGVGLRRLHKNADQRGHLTELHSKRSEDHAELVHIYQVLAQPGSIRAWVYHCRQSDRLCFTQGRFQVALYDLRPESPTFQRFVLLRVGVDNPVQVEIPSFVVHGVCNVGTEAASFINFPTTVWQYEAPDKRRLRYPDPRLPFTFG